MAAGSEALVLKISADTTAVAAGLEPMSSALDGLKTTAAKTSEQLGALSDTSVAPTVDTAGMDKLGTAVDTTTEDLRKLDTVTVSPTADTSTVEALGTAIDDTKDSAEQLSRSPITIEMRRQALDKARQDIEALKDRIAEEVQMGVSTRDSEKELSALQRSVDTLTDEDHVIDVTMDDTDTSFALEKIGKLRKSARALTDAFVSLQTDGLNTLPGTLNTANSALIVLNSSVDTYLEKQVTAGKQAGSFARGLGSVTSVLSGAWGLAIGAGITLLGTWISKQDDAADATKEWADSLDYTAGAMDRSNRQKVATKLIDSGLIENAKRLGISSGELVTALQTQGDITEWVWQRTKGLGDSIDVVGRKPGKLAKDYGLLQVGLRDLSAAMDVSRVNAAELAEAVDDTGIASSVAARVTEQHKSQVDDLATAYDKAIGSIKLFNGVVGDTHAKQIAVKEDFANLREIVGEAGRAVNHARTAFDLSSKKGREAETQIDRTAAAIADLTQTQIDYAIKHGKSTDKIVANYGKQRQQLIDTAIQLGLSKTAAEKYVDQLLDTPKEVKTKVTESGAKEVKDAIDDIPKTVYTTVHIVPALERWNQLPKRLQDAISGNGSVNLSTTSGVTPPAPAPSAGLTLLQPRLYLDGRPIRYALRGDVQSTVAAQLAATRTRGRL